MFKNIDDLLGDKLDEVKLKPDNSSGQVHLFGKLTDKIAREWYDISMGYNNCFLYVPYDDKDEKFVHGTRKIVERYAKIGVLCSMLQQEGGKFYDIGCGLAIPSFAYSLSSGRKAIAIDFLTHNIESSKKISRKLGAKISFKDGLAEETINLKKIKPEDVLLFAGADLSLHNYWKIIKDIDCTLVLYTCLSAIREYYIPFVLFGRNNPGKIASKLIKHHFKKYKPMLNFFCNENDPNFITIVKSSNYK